MSRRVDYLNYLLNGGDSRELPAPASREDEVLYEACVNGGGVKTGAGAEGFYRCKVHNTGNGNIDFIGSFLDLGETRVSTVKVKAVVTVRSNKVKGIGLRLFSNNDANKEMLNGGYASNATFDNLAKPSSEGAELPVGGKYTLQATFNDSEAKTLVASRYLKAFISITKPAKEDICTLDVHEFTIEINDKIYNIIDSVFNFQEGLSSSFKYIQEEYPSACETRRKSQYFNKVLACLGDSITNGYDPAKGDGTALANPWRIQLRHECGFINVKNYGINGRMISKDKEDGTKSILNLVSNINEFPVAGIDVLTVFGGINDFSNKVPLGKFVEVKEEGVEYDVNTFYGALQALYEKLIQRLGQEFPVLAINLLNANNSVLVESAKALGYASVEEGINAYREAIRVCAKHYGIACLELQDVVGFDLFKEEDNTKYSGDLLHPNQLGHDLMANIIGEAIEKLV